LQFGHRSPGAPSTRVIAGQAVYSGVKKRSEELGDNGSKRRHSPLTHLTPRAFGLRQECSSTGHKNPLHLMLQ
jgi:hypothetical protein